jgi:hypothetical protein
MMQNQFDCLLKSLTHSLAQDQAMLRAAQDSWTQAFYRGRILALEHAIALAKIHQYPSRDEVL